MDPHRSLRVAEGLREELDELINYELSDPRVGPATVSDVYVSPDFKRAHVRLVLQGSTQEQAATLDAITHAKQFLRRQLAVRLQLFHTPDLEFDSALSPGLGSRAPEILKRIRRGRPKS